jgi:hypothetical protein
MRDRAIAASLVSFCVFLRAKKSSRRNTTTRRAPVRAPPSMNDIVAMIRELVNPSQSSACEFSTAVNIFKTKLPVQNRYSA